MSNDDEEAFDSWFSQNGRTYYVWSSTNLAGTPVWTVIEVTVHEYPDDAVGEGSYISNASLYASAKATNPEQVMECGDKADISAEDIPGEAMAALESMLLADANLDVEYEVPTENGDSE